MTIRLARRMSELTTSEIRELLKITERPEILSFAGGVPDPALFPVSALAAAAARLLAEEGERALQYSTSEGYAPLRRWIAAHLGAAGVHATPDQVLVVAGSQQGLDLTAKVFLDEGDAVLCESPTYLGALSAFRVFRPRLLSVPCDDQGPRLDALEHLLAHERPKLFYVVPNAQNPSGRTWSTDRRRDAVALAGRHCVPIVEDAAYLDLCFSGVTPPSLKAFDAGGLVVSIGTFSKILCPGLRVGWVLAEAPLFEKYLIVKQSADLHASTLSQMLIARYLASADFEAELARLRAAYRERRDAMVEALEAELPDGCRFTRPEGGLFVFLELPEGVDARELLRRCLERRVAFVPGSPFFVGGGHPGTARLSYANLSPERIREGVRRLAACLREILAAAPTPAS